MKTRILIALLSLTAVYLCHAKNAGWNKNEKPKISLVEAHTKALEALKPKNIDYYCLPASVARTFSECDWELHFAAANKTEIWVSIGTDAVRVSEHGFHYCDALSPNPAVASSERKPTHSHLIELVCVNGFVSHESLDQSWYQASLLSNLSAAGTVAACQGTAHGMCGPLRAGGKCDLDEMVTFYAGQEWRLG